MKIEELYRHFKESTGVSTDTRNIQSNSIFFALKGANFNGNKFSTQALESGAMLAVVDEARFRPNDRIVLVENVLETLQQLAAFHRQQISVTVIGLTGSNGKTTTKELIAAVLRKKYKVHSTAGNLNNHIGVPLTLLKMPIDTELAIIEMGANQPNDIRELCDIANPDVGMITNIGNAHLQGFGNREGVIKAKGQLFNHLRKINGLVFVHSSDTTLVEMSDGMKNFTYSTGSESGKVKGQLVGHSLRVAFEWSCDNFQSGKIQTQLTGGYNLSNLLAAASIGIHFGIDGRDISAALAEYEPQNNRSQIKKTAENTLILDAYNANPSSVAAALKDFALIHAEKKFFILGDMLELGNESSKAHEEVLKTIQQLNLKGFVVGQEFKTAVNRIDSSTLSFDNTEVAADYLRTNKLSGFHILIKGSRGIQLEKLVPEL